MKSGVINTNIDHGRFVGRTRKSREVILRAVRFN